MMKNLYQKEQFYKAIKMDLMMELVKDVSSLVGALSDDQTPKNIVEMRVADIYCSMAAIVYMNDLDVNRINENVQKWAKNVNNFFIEK